MQNLEGENEVMDEEKMEVRRTAPYFTFGVYIDQLPWKYDNLFADYRTFVEPWRTGNRGDDDLGTVKGTEVRNDGSFENGNQNCALAKRTNGPQAGSGARLTKNQLALMIYFAFETNPVTGICNTSIPGVMSLFGWEQRQNNTRGVNIAKTELRLLEERHDNHACKDTIGIVPMFEPESMKFSRNLKYRLDGDGECDPSLGKFVFIDSRTYAKISDYCFTHQKGNPSDMLYVYMYLKSIMSYVEDPNKNQNKAGRSGDESGWCGWGDPEDIANDLGIGIYKLKSILADLDESEVIWSKQRGRSRMFYFATKNNRLLWDNLEERIRQKAGR